ncbi:MAG: hypothetical protein HFG27_04530 [Provencibacterium sp.]|nr:hypothetical protein [Provencibacterium sp.]
MIIYVDVLIVLNFIVNYLLLAAAARFGGGVASRLRLALSALLGAFFSLTLFLPPLPPVVNAAMKLGLSCLLAAVAGGYRDIWGYFKRLFLLLAASFLFAGLMLFAALLGGGENLLFYNGICYFPISGMKLLLGSAAAYAAVSLWQRLFRRGMAAQEPYRVLLCVGGKTAELAGEMDSQNHLIDLFSGTPVAVGPRALLEPVLPPGICRALSGDFSDSVGMRDIRMIPCRTVAGEELLPAFRPDRMILENKNGKLEIEDVYIAVAARLDDAGTKKLLLNPALTGRKTENLRIKGGA